MVWLAFFAAAPSAAEVVRYRLELQISWSPSTHSFEWPAEGGHLSDLTGVTHNSRYVMFDDGRTASSGLRLIAENGRAGIMLAELEEARRRNRIGQIIYGEKLERVPGSILSEFEASEDHPLVSFVTMLAPSPDWFTGAASIRLRADGAWRDRVEGQLYAWDAGTDSGKSYLAENSETQPAESIRLLATPHFLTASGLLPVGRYLIERLD
ncbi:MAG: spondin domain-containing protein [Gammaproteobacteria bacterium]|nr:spondin domain-containing protein [Gammaproteobacteria bacterium]